jgi:hypothetical protein
MEMTDIDEAQLRKLLDPVAMTKNNGNNTD